MSILTRILARAEERLEERRAHLPLSELKRRVADLPDTRSFRGALSGPDLALIAEVKKRSPSEGPMDPANVAAALDVYEQCPAVRAISILTDQDYFEGSIHDLARARQVTSKPLLRKDFIFDEYQVWEARAFGADAILLMAAVHAGNPSRLGGLFELARSLKLDVLVELGDSQASARHLKKSIPTAADIWGVNCRRFRSRWGLRFWLGHLTGRDLVTNRSRHRELRSLVPAGAIAVAESGIKLPEHLDDLVRAGYDAALIGTAFLKGPDPVLDVVGRFADRVAFLRSQASRAA